MKNIIQESDRLSVFYADSVSIQLGQEPLLIEVTEGGEPKTLWVLRGITFVDENNEPVIPSFVITNDEYFLLAMMLEHKDFDESGDEVLIERTLPMDWDEIYAMVIAMREAAAAESTELGNEQEQQP
jgi:hypothetical protein